MTLSQSVVYVMLCYVMLCYVMLCYVMLCYVMLCYVMLCYVMLCYVMASLQPWFSVQSLELPALNKYSRVFVTYR